MNFWATWCPPCVEELPSLNEFQRRMAASGVVVLGVSVDKNEQAYKKFLARSKVVFQTARDPEAFARSLGAFQALVESYQFLTDSVDDATDELDLIEQLASDNQEAPAGAETCQRTFLSGPNSVTGVWPAARPEPFGPRNCGHDASAAA